MATLLAFIPHPDDESYTFGGLVALAARAGWACFVHCATSGESGTRYDAGRSGKDALASAREGELAESCRILGADPPVFWRLPDGGLRSRAPETARIVRAIRACNADLVLTLGADGVYGHPDHVTLHRWVTTAWHSLEGERPPLLFAAFPRGLFIPQWVRCIGMMGNPPSPARDEIGAPDAHYRINITDVANTKLRAIAAHRTQLPGGDPDAIFPHGIVASLLDFEWYGDAAGCADLRVQRLLDSLA
ncbi:MAG: PIG-L family deacetylase [Dehalococcoidia bacterium]|nr:PIG-L family deacetylase [Dehalococcoidia bacterium]